MAQYRLAIASRSGGSRRLTKSRSRIEAVKAALLGVLGLGLLIGIVLAAFVVGSIIASVLLILLGLAFIVWAVRFFARRWFRVARNLSERPSHDPAEGVPDRN